MDYYPYGGIRIDSGSFNEQRKYAGHEYDADTTLSYMNARYYDSAIGRFVSQDPEFWKMSKLDILLVDPQSWNSYTYARNNPLLLVDENGEFWHIVAGAAIGAAISGGITYWQTGDLHQAASAAAGGAVTGALFAAVGPASLIGSIGTGAGSVTVGNSITRTLNGEKITAESVVSDAAAGAVGGGLGYGMSKAIGSVFGSTAKSTIQINKATGEAFEKTVGASLQKTQFGVVPQLTVRTGSGITTRLDFAGRIAGKVCLTECKSSITAPLTRNQSLAFPEIQQSGGTIMGKGKSGLPGGTVIPPTKVQVIRP